MNEVKASSLLMLNDNGLKIIYWVQRILMMAFEIILQNKKEGLHEKISCIIT